MRAGIAGGHPATVAAGLEILTAGGSAADAAVAACLASCVAETVMTGLLGGGHALWSNAPGDVLREIDFFVNVPGLGASRPAAPLETLAVPFGTELVHYAIGVASCAVPGVPAGLERLWREWGRLPWPRLVAPALRLARDGVVVPPAHASCLAMLAPVMTLREGALVYAPGGRLLEAGDTLRQPGLERAFQLLMEEGAGSLYSGTLADSLLALVEERGGAVTPDDLAAYEVVVREPACRSGYAGRTLVTRASLASPLAALSRLPPLRPLDPGARAVALAHALSGPERDGDTTNLTVVDHEGNVCVLTTSLGLGSGDWLARYDLHLNSMLGEVDLLSGPLVPGERMASMMAPLVVLGDGDDGVVLAAGAAGGTRLRSALVQVLAGVLDEGLSLEEAVVRPRLHPVGDAVHIEPGWEEAALDALAAAGYEVRRWPALHHYFGGVSAIGPDGGAGDPRRSGATETVSRP
ncbi:MAG: gamma-glutamyltransferase [Actinobacteria bacterium]|nr:gamma-glutamyltransferase [Actinomycetota bacterium]